MGYPPEMTGTVNGMTARYPPNTFLSGLDPRYGGQNFATYDAATVYQNPPSQVGHLPGQYAQSPYTPVHSDRPRAQAFSSPIPPKSSGFAVVIPSPIPSHPQSQRTPSMPDRPRQPLQTTQHVAPSPAVQSTPVTSARSVLQPPSIDYQLLLLSLADEYIAAARAHRALRSISHDTYIQQCYKLLAAGLGCMEVVVKHFKLQPLLDASVRLRYASILHEETQNLLEAEQTLSDGIKLCDRYRLFDLKYNMQHLLSRVLFDGSPRASSRFLDKVIEDAQAYGHSAWVYAFRFLKSSLFLRTSSHQDILSAHAQLKNISALADTLGDKAVHALSSTLEALIHLRESSSVESLEQAQRALAMARSLQFDPKHFDPSQAVSKMQAMQISLETQNDAWQVDGSLLVPVHSQTASRSPNGSGVVRGDVSGSLSVSFSWTPQNDIYALGYMLSSLAIAHRNTSDGLRSEQMLKEGLRCLEKDAGGHYAMVEFASHGSVRPAREQLQEFEQAASPHAKEPEFLDILAQYLHGVIKQGTGEFDAALSVFQSPYLSIGHPTTCVPAHLDLAILSVFNSILILRTPSHPSHGLLSSLMSSLEPHLSRIKNSKALASAYNIILATPLDPPPTIVRTKQYLQHALQAARGVSNNQLICITLNFMSYKFFKGVVGEQAEKSARASENLARKGMDGLWQSVSSGLLADTLDMAGRAQEAESMREVGREIARSLPKGVIQWEDEEGHAEVR
ncbi:MAG: hypothetical protein LQ352_001038 [Teloschistes flavicans]|nr:MAG: hypothetical protein LQ352_001038 [Teloschistes flavicans]